MARPRPACAALPERVADLSRRAATAVDRQDTAAASAVFNLAALLASDCGLPELARQWSHRLARAALRREPQNGRQAIHSLQPIVNLARLRNRAGDGPGAWVLLENLYHAITTRTDTIIDTIEIPAARLTIASEAHRELCTWLWATLLSDGARALTLAGRWRDAHSRLSQYKGVGHRMLDGRQIAVIANATSGNHDAALALLRNTQPGDPWEAAVTACLTLLCTRHHSADPADPRATYHVLDTTTPGLAVFHTRLGLSMIDALVAANQPTPNDIAADLLHRATADGYAARDVLAHPRCRTIATDQQLHSLAGLVDVCGLGTGRIPDRLLLGISAALDAAEHAITRTDKRAVSVHETAHGTADDRAAASLTTVDAMASETANPTDPDTRDPEQLRAALADRIRGFGAFRTPEVEAAFRTVPRHLFLPGVDLATAYAPQVVVTKRADDGTALSSASSPHLVATMLEQLEVRHGHRVLEIGTATGINAALLTELAGPTGTVVTIEIDDELADGARTALATAGYEHVEVICGDGAHGHPAGAPYDRIVVTAGAWDLPAAWWQQLAIGGRLVVPLRLYGGLTRSIGFDHRQHGRMVSTSAQMCGFVPMRGAAEHAERSLQLAEGVDLHVDPGDLGDESALSQVLTHPAHEQWTGIRIHDDDPVAHLDLWLATTSGIGFAKLAAEKLARDRGLVDPAWRWGGASLYDAGTLAYLAFRPLSDELAELGVIAHGPDSTKLAAHISDLLRQWDRTRPAEPLITTHRTETLEDKLAPGARIVRPETAVTLAWQPRQP